jgi:pimeloyl-ACP methyl ester carboxylesterase
MSQSRENFRRISRLFFSSFVEHPCRLIRKTSRRVQDYTPLLPEIAATTLIIVGGDDEFTPISDAEYLRERIPNSRMAVIEETGRLPNLERPDEFKLM